MAVSFTQEFNDDVIKPLILGQETVEIGPATMYLVLSQNITSSVSTDPRTPAETPIFDASYEDKSFTISDWVFYSGSPTGDSNDSMVSLKNTISFNAATVLWGQIKELLIYRAGAPYTEYYIGTSSWDLPYSLPIPYVSVGDAVVFLGSPVHGEGDIRLVKEVT